MKVAIIGAGNMGGAIARGMAKGSLVRTPDITVADLSQPKLDELKAEFPEMNVTQSNKEAAADADYVVLAVKPWLVDPVLTELALAEEQTLVSVAAGITFESLGRVCRSCTMFRLIPNTAISMLQSMTLIAAHNASDEQQELLLKLFDEMGVAMLIGEDKMAAATALTSCGIAYVLKYIQAAMQAGVEMGLYPKDAMLMVAQSVKGAAELILPGNTHPSTEIDKVCTPGGITIKGINELDHAGFPSAIIKAMKAAR
jgi:pyrroline-5-carboxylate reductase